METSHVIMNKFGDEWILEYEESEYLTTFDGFLVVWRDISRITLSVHLSPSEKILARRLLERRLSDLPLGSAVTILWHRDGR
jgi:hypothetical protein